MAVKVRHWDKETQKSHSTLEHIGLVVNIGSTYIGDGDSHYWADVFNPETGQFETVGLGYTPYDATVDAPADLQKIWDDLVAAKRASAMAANALSAYARALETEAWHAEQVKKGSWVKVVKGRKVPIGTVGQVKWEGEGQWGWRVLLDVNGEDVWTAGTNVEALLWVGPEVSPAQKLREAGWDEETIAALTEAAA